MALFSNDPNARYDAGPNCAGAGRVGSPSVALYTFSGYCGVRSDGCLAGTALRVGFSAAGVPRSDNSTTAQAEVAANYLTAYSNVGGNVAGAPRSPADLG